MRCTEPIVTNATCRRTSCAARWVDRATGCALKTHRHHASHAIHALAAGVAPFTFDGFDFGFEGIAASLNTLLLSYLFNRLGLQVTPWCLPAGRC
jgi:hypothetical protein